MSIKPLVSVVMPLYNKRSYVRRAIESIRRQTFDNWELIVVDDGSTDGSAEEVPKNDPRIKLFRQENKGPSAARNRAVEKSLGEFVEFIDADDWYYPFKIEKEMKLLRDEKMADWMMSAFECEKSQEIKVFYIKDVQGNKIDKDIFVSRNAFGELTVAGWHIDGLCMRKSLFQGLGGFREDLHYGEITELEIRCALAQPRGVICQTPLYRVVHVANSASRNVIHRIDNMQLMGEIYHRLSLEYPAHSARLKDSSRQSFYSYGAVLSINGRGQEARKCLSKHFPYARDRRWWKMWMGSWIPKAILQRIVKTDVDYRQI
jgi:glycosyltransferase involved in cell wall biosynthesis